MSRSVNVFKVTTSRFLGVSDVKERMGSDFLIDVVLLETIDRSVEKDIACIINLTLPKEYKKLLTDNAYYSKHYQRFKVLRDCKSEIFELNDGSYYVDVSFRFGLEEYGGSVRIELFGVNAKGELAQSDIITFGFSEYRETYDVVLGNVYDQYVRVIVK